MSTVGHRRTVQGEAIHDLPILCHSCERACSLMVTRDSVAFEILGSTPRGLSILHHNYERAYSLVVKKLQ
jgi:hypothetical protein